MTAGDDKLDGVDDNKTGGDNDADIAGEGSSKYIAAEGGMLARADIDVHGLSAMFASIADSSFCTK